MKGDPARLDADETKLYNQMRDEADPEAVEALKKKNEKKKDKEKENKRKMMEKTEKQVGSGKGRQGRVAKPQTRDRHTVRVFWDSLFPNSPGFSANMY